MATLFRPLEGSSQASARSRGGIERVGLLFRDAGKKSVFHGAGARQAPAVSGYVFSNGLLDDADGCEGCDEFAAELLEGAFFAGKAGVSATAQAVN